MTDWKAQARRLLAGGMPLQKVAEIMGKTTVEIEVLALEKIKAQAD